MGLELPCRRWLEPQQWLQWLPQQSENEIKRHFPLAGQTSPLAEMARCLMTFYNSAESVLR